MVRREPEIEVLPPLAMERLRIAVKRSPLMTVSPLKLRARSKLSASRVEKKEGVVPESVVLAPRVRASPKD